MSKYLIPIILFLMCSMMIWNFIRNNRLQNENLYYGVKANEKREKLFIPIIDDQLTSNWFSSFFPIGDRWDSGYDLPKDDEVLHLWKIVTLPKYFGSTYEEKDAFRKKYNDTLYYQMNLFARVSSDTLVKRQGSIFLLNHNHVLDMRLNSAQIDSVAQIWGLDYLVRK
ncbi:MAG: hypothetical protein WAT22_12245 [Saprospiraceae bacterium]|nr:hypothetical protein [Saprospiraceae bacterium]MBP6447058.1 hypothetical protein [Saprospiraceae bacterium]